MASIGLLLLIILRLILQTLLYRSGFEAISADEFGRIVLAANWAQQPFAVWEGSWLPFHMYAFGTALKLHWDLLYFPRLIVVLLGFISIGLIYLLASKLFGSSRIALISAFLLAVNPVHIWLSSTPVTAVPNATLLLAATLCLVQYWQKDGLRYIFIGAIMLALANGFRFESWIFSALFSFSLLVNGILCYRRGELDSRHIGALAFGVTVPWLYPVAWIMGNYLGTANPFHFMESIRSYKETWYDPAISYRNYLSTLLTIDPYTTVLALLALLTSLLGYRNSWAVRWYVVMATVPFALFIYSHGGQIEPQGNYYRYLTFFLIMAYPAVANLISDGVDLVAKPRTANVILLVVILSAVGFTQTRTLFQFVNDPAADGLAVGQQIRVIRSEQPELAHRPMLVELSYWQYLAVHVGANDTVAILYDRKLDLAQRQTESLLETDIEQFRSCLASKEISYMIFKSPGLQQIVEESMGIMPSEEINGYAFYPVDGEFGDVSRSDTFACPLE